MRYLILAAAFCLCGSARADFVTTTLTPIDTGLVSEIRRGSGMFNFSSPAGPFVTFENPRDFVGIFQQRGGVLFDLTGIPGDAVFASVTLSVTVGNAESQVSNSADLRLLGFGSNRPELAGTDLIDNGVSVPVATFGFALPFTGPRTFEANLLSFLSRIDTPYVGFSLASVQRLTSGNVSLTVAYSTSTPEPSSLVLCGLGGVAGLVVARARRQPVIA